MTDKMPDALDELVKLVGLITNETFRNDDALLGAMEVLAKGALQSDRELLELIKILGDRVEQLEVMENTRFKLLQSVVQKLNSIEAMMIKIINDESVH